jgi:hypothetical protein
MVRKSNFWSNPVRKSRKARRGSASRESRKGWSAGSVLSVERLEDRYMLAADPGLSIIPNQFFGQNTQALVSAYAVPFRATFTDALEQADLDNPHYYSATVNWGDGSPLEFSGEPHPPSDEGGANVGVVFHQSSNIFTGPAVGDPVSGRVEGRHNYATTGQFNVTVTLNDVNGGSATQSSLVNVYPYDNGLSISADGVEPHISDIGLTPRVVGDITEQTPYTFTLDGSSGINPNITSWAISWGDSIETLNGNPSSAVHAYDDYHDFTYPGDEGGGSHPAHVIVSAAVTSESGTYFVHSIEYDIHDFQPIASVTPVSTDINEGEPYTLNFSYVDPGAPVQTWIMLWGDEDFTVDGLTILPGDTTSATHNYPANGDASYQLQVIPINTDNQALVAFFPEAHVHNVVPTLENTIYSVPENSPNGTVVGTLPVTNPANDNLAFSVLGGSGAGVFAVNPTTGEITVTNGSLLDFATHPTFTLNVEVTDNEGGVDTATVTINVARLANISGYVFVDVNHNGLFDANEIGIDGVPITLLDASGTTVLDTAVTSNDGLYLFEGLQPGVYQIAETQPTGVTDGAEHLGSLGGTIVANDRMRLTIAGHDATDYVFAEFGQQVSTGDSAGVGFWHSKNGQALIAQGGTQLAQWLTSTFSNIFGNTLVGMTGSQVATFYRDQVFKGLSKSGGTPKVDAEFFAVALATYFTDLTLAGQVAAAYHFNVTDTGIGTKIVNVGTKGAAFNVANGSDRTIMQLLLATNDLTDQPNSILGYAAVYDRDGNGVISSAEASLRSMANVIFSSINGSGGI